MELRKRNFSTAFCSNGSNFIHFFAHFQNAFFTCFSNRFSRRIFSHFSLLFTKVWKTCEKMRFENAVGKNVKKKAFWKCTWGKMWKNVKNVKKNENPVGEEELWFCFFRFDFLGSSFAAITLLPAQLLQVENRRGAVQIDRKWTVQIADLFNTSIAKQWLPGAKT